MIAWINFAVLVIATVLTLVTYLKSVRPAALEQEIGPAAYRRCTTYRLICAGLLCVTTVNYVLYFFFPLPIGLPERFAWDWWVSAVIAGLIAVPSLWIMIRGTLDAGEETLLVKKEHTLYGGIYQKIRHPQAAGEMFLWWVMAFLLHSPFLALYSFIWVPIFVIMCWAEEKDLVIRYGESYQAYQKQVGFLFPKVLDQK